MIINRQALLSKLESTMPGLADKKDFIESYLHFSFNKDKIVTFNESVAVTAPIETDLVCSIPASAFHSLVKKINDETIQMEIKDNQLHIQANKTKAAINIVQDDTIPKAISAIGIEPDSTWFPLPSNFQDAILQCGISVDETQLLPWMTTLNIKGNRVLSTDSYRISQYLMNDTIEDSFHEETHIPFSSITGAIGIDFKEYFITKNWFHMRTEDGLTYSAKLVEIEDVPDMEKYFTLTGDDFILPEDSARVIDLVAVLSEDDKKSVRWVKIAITTNTVTFKCEKQGVGWVEKELLMEYSGLPINFYLNPQAAATILKKTRKITVTDKFCIFDHDNFKHIIALIGEDS